MKNKIGNIISIIAMTIAFTSCVREELLSPYPNGEEGKRVKVELSFKIPPAITPQQVQSRGVSDNTDFSIEFFNEEESTVKTRSESVSKLYNLWLFQFKPNGDIHGSPQQVSDQVNMVNDMTLLNTTLRVGDNQTIYIVVLGKQVTTISDLTQVRTITDLENIQLDYTDNKNGLYYSRITNESEVPYAGSATGVSIREVDDSENGEIVYGTPDGFSGGIEVKRLVSRIMLKHKFDLTTNTLEGMRLLKVPTKLCINPAAVSKETIESIPMVTLESDNAFGEGDKDTDGFFTSQWYVAQNEQGTVTSSIASERDRYRIVNDDKGTTGDGNAPLLGTNIEAWSYSKSSRDVYTVHQIYVGNNNTDNFDVKINNYYNIRTVINSGDLSDKRIRSYTTMQKIYLSAESVVRRSGTDTNSKIDGITSVYFDAHYGWRPVIIQARGRKVTVGIYKDEECTQLVNMNDPKESWLQLSSYPNYTEVVRNGSASTTALANQFETNIFVPTRFKLYLYADEYITNDDGSITNYDLDENTFYSFPYKKDYNDPDKVDFLKTRTLYVKVKTTEITAEGTPKALEAIYSISQKQGYYVGLFGGDIQNGQYTQGLIIDAFNENSYRLDDQYPASGSSYSYLYFGYNKILTNYTWNPANTPEQNYPNFVNGEQATLRLATNPNNYAVNTGKESQIAAMRKINGVIDLYQYNYYNTFQARFCHDLNRDKNGNGVIDYFPNDPLKNELEWYLPATYQGLGIIAAAGTIKYNTPMVLALETNISNSPGFGFNRAGWTSSNIDKIYTKNLRCVRNIPATDDMKKGTKATTYTTVEGDTYAMIDLSNLPRGIADKTTTTQINSIYEQLDLYSYSTAGILYNETTPVKDTSKSLGEKVLRMKRNITQEDQSAVSTGIQIATTSSSKFIISPTDVYNDGDTQLNATSDILKDVYDNSTPSNSVKMTWAEANGRLNTANSQAWTLESQAMKTGCYAYRGKSGKDVSGTWRVPNIRELSMIMIFAHDLEKNATMTNFNVPYKYPAMTTYADGYWSATEYDGQKGSALGMALDINYGLAVRENDKSGRYLRLRCIKDIP